MTSPKTGLMTRSAGRIGRTGCAELLARGQRVRGFDPAPSPSLADQIDGDLSCPTDAERAMLFPSNITKVPDTCCGISR